MSIIHFRPDALLRFRKMETLRVLMALFEKLDDGNRVVVHRGQLAEELEVTRAYVSIAIKQLKRSEAITKSTKVGMGWLYQLNPNLVWKGSVEDHDKAVEMYERMKAARITGVVANPAPKEDPK